MEPQRMERNCKPLKVLVGAAGFEPATSCSQSRRATRLRHAPNVWNSFDSKLLARYLRAIEMAIMPSSLWSCGVGAITLSK